MEYSGTQTLTSGTGISDYTDAKPVRSKQVLAACERLEKAQARTFELAENLEQALQGVLRAVSNDGSKLGGAIPPQEATVPLAEMIHHSIGRTERLNEQLVSILNRLEV